MRFGIIMLVIGQRRSGKSTKIKKIISTVNSPKYIYDVRNEYYSTGFNMSMDDFLEIVQNVKESVIVFEEATIFFKGTTNKAMRDILTGCSHNKNFILLAFHSFRAVPVDILELVDYIAYGKTKDRVSLIYEKYKDDPTFIEMFEDSQKLEKYQFKIKRYG
jgi:AAA+ ATPase superfamily predicted ATPase